MSSRYDLAVVGGGSAGFSAAIAAAELGARAALIGHGTIGGTCVNIGCVPSKNLIRATEALYHANNAARFGGMGARGCVEDWRGVIRRKDELVSSLRRAKYIDLLPNYGDHRDPDIEQPRLMLGHIHGRMIVDLEANRPSPLRQLG